jgi:NADH:ubiquinone oxidoreductase subunit 5 (subunit L)/multisubunit Na+/H+ antiporter MnhA subunit
MAPVFAEAPLARVAMVLVGAATAAYGSLVGRVQTDVKNALAYATMAQIGIMFIEVGLGLHVLAVIHLVLHATLRALQLLRAPAILHDTERVRAALGDPRGAHSTAIERAFPARLERALYHLALEAFYLDAIVQRFVAAPVERLAHLVDRIDRALFAVLILAKRADGPLSNPPREEGRLSHPPERRET